MNKVNFKKFVEFKVTTKKYNSQFKIAKFLLTSGMTKSGVSKNNIKK